jgi:hypothetical protein
VDEVTQWLVEEAAYVADEAGAAGTPEEQAKRLLLERHAEMMAARAAR